MSLRVIGPVTARCQYCDAWVCNQLPDEHSHTIQLDYDNTCDVISLLVDSKVLFVVDLADWEVLHKQLEAMIGT